MKKKHVTCEQIVKNYDDKNVTMTYMCHMANKRSVYLSIHMLKESATI